MRHRYYDFVLAIINGAMLIGFAVWGGAGWAWVGWWASFGWQRYFSFVLQMIAYSNHFTAGDASNSTNGKRFENCEALGEQEVEIEVTEMLKPVGAENKDVAPVAVTMKAKVKVAAFPKVVFFEGGTGSLGLANKYGGRELGYYIIDERLLLNMSNKGNLVAFAEEWTLSPQKGQLLRLLRRVKPTETDDRIVLPPEYWAILKAHKRFDVNKSPVHLFIDPMYPIIYKDEFKDLRLMLPGKDLPPKDSHMEHTCKRCGHESIVEIKVSPVIYPIDIRLRDLIGDQPILALLPGVAAQVNGETARAARQWAGREINKKDEYIQTLETEIAKLRRLDQDGGGRRGVTEFVTTTVQGPDETGQRMG